MRNLELPTPISPCLRVFIESLLDDADGRPGWSRTAQSGCAGEITAGLTNSQISRIRSESQ